MNIDNSDDLIRTLKVLYPARRTRRLFQPTERWRQSMPAAQSDAEKEYLMGYGRTAFRRFVTEDMAPKTWNRVANAGQKRLLAYVEALQALQAGDNLALQKACLNLMRSRLFGGTAEDNLSAPEQPLEHASEALKKISKVLGSLHNTARGLRAASERLMELLVRDPEGARSTFAAELSNQLKQVRLVLWYRNGRMIPALVCPELSAAFLIRTLMSAAGANVGIRLCPNCSRVFLQKRPDQNYCSVRCREAHRVARFRAKQAASKRGGARVSKTVMRGPGKDRRKAQ